MSARREVIAYTRHGFFSVAVTRLCQSALPTVVLLQCLGYVDLDRLVAWLWWEILRWPMAHWAMLEALVAAFTFLGWILWFFWLNEVPFIKRYRLVKRTVEQPRKTSCIGMKSLSQIAASLPLYLGAIFVLLSLKQGPSLPRDPPSAVRLAGEVALGIWAYDFIFFWIHLLMHKFPNSWYHHEVHHELKVHPVCGTNFLGPELVVHHSLVDGAMQVLVNILVQNLPLLGCPKHKLSRLVHNVLVTYLLSEAHSGLDLPWSSHRLAPKLLGGAYRHELHHHRRDCCFHQFFCYLDDWLGHGPPVKCA